MKYKKGDRVKVTDPGLHQMWPMAYPPAGTVGTVTFIDSDGDMWVRWPDGTLEDDNIMDPIWGMCVMPEMVDPAEGDRE